MARDDRFAVMDVATDVALDAKFKRLARVHPELLATSFMAYIGLLGESWSSGTRVAMDDGWPPILPFEEAALDALKEVSLLDKTGKIPAKAWSGWFSQAKARREQSRDRWRRANEKRRAETSPVPRGDSAATGAILPSVPTVPTVENLRTDSARESERADVVALLDRGWPKVTRAQRKVLDEVLDRHDVTGAEFAAEVIRATPADADPLAAVMDADRRWQAAEAGRADAESRAWERTKAEDRESSARAIASLLVHIPPAEERPDDEWFGPIEAPR